LLQALQDTTASVYFVPDLFVSDWIHGRPGAVCGLPVISVCDTPLRGWGGVAKRLGDLVLASVLLVLLLPLLGLSALAIRLDSPGPVLFRQRRYGLDGEEITVYKFRSMRVAQDGPDVPQARRNDPRVTRIGAWLRRLSLDELPQLVNVLQGRMSLVGPRPHAVAHNEMYRQQIRSYMVRHKVRPGITGWAQVHGFRGETESLEKMEGRIRLDIDYLRRWSPWLDLYILLRTVRVLMGDPRAY
jgi:putative colanic acid biosynthesis UDP-glucose lipid carrier transferase